MNATSNEYRDFLERLKIEFGEFISLAEDGYTIRLAGLKSRKQSMRLRELFKLYRKVSRKNDMRIKIIMDAAKEKVKEN